MGILKFKKASAVSDEEADKAYDFDTTRTIYTRNGLKQRMIGYLSVAWLVLIIQAFLVLN